MKIKTPKIVSPRVYLDTDIAISILTRARVFLIEDKYRHICVAVEEVSAISEINTAGALQQWFWNMMGKYPTITTWAIDNAPGENTKNIRIAWIDEMLKYLLTRKKK